MIVVCESCSQKYRISDSKLPPGGGNIKCPSCGHVFFVQPPAPDLQALPSLPDSTSTFSDDDGATMVGSIPSMLLGGQQPPAGQDLFSSLPGLPGGAGPAFEDDGSTFVGKPSMLMQQALAKDSNAAPTWKLKTNFGLVFDFPDVDRMREWLSNRDTLEGYEASRDGVSFVSIDQIPELMTAELQSKLESSDSVSHAPPSVVAPSTSLSDTPAPLGGGAPAPLGGAPSPLSGGAPAPLGGGAPAPLGGGAPAPLGGGAPSPLGGGTPAPLSGGAPLGDPIQRPIQRPRPRPRPGPRSSTKESSNTWIFAVVALFAVFGLFATLEATGVTHFRKKPAKKAPSSTVQPTANTNSEDPNGLSAVDEMDDTEEEVLEEDTGQAAAPSPFSFQGRVTSMIGQAEKEMREGEYKDAVRTLNSAKGLAPKNIQIYKLLEQAYSRSGNREAAREAANTRRELEREP